MSEKDQLINYLDRARAGMHAVIENMDSDQEIYPGWGMRENIAHIAGWDEVTIKALRAFLNTGEHYLLPDKSFDAHNEDMLKARAAMSFEEVLQEWKEMREALKILMADLSEEDLEIIIPFPWGLQGTIKDMLYIIAEHEREHFKELDN